MPGNFRNVRAWQHAHRLTLGIYRATRTFPNDERFGVTAQIRRAASSVAANIAESSSTSSQPNQIRILEIALGSLRETEYFLLLAKDLKYLAEPEYENLNAVLDETARTLNGLINSIKNRKSR